MSPFRPLEKGTPVTVRDDGDDPRISTVYRAPARMHAYTLDAWNVATVTIVTDRHGLRHQGLKSTPFKGSARPFGKSRTRPEFFNPSMEDRNKTMDFPKGSLVLHFWVGSACKLILTPAGIARLTPHADADALLASMRERRQVGTYMDEHIMPLALVAQHGLLCAEDFIFITQDGTVVTGPTEWGHA